MRFAFGSSIAESSQEFIARKAVMSSDAVKQIAEQPHFQCAGNERDGQLPVALGLDLHVTATLMNDLVAEDAQALGKLDPTDVPRQAMAGQVWPSSGRHIVVRTRRALGWPHWTAAAQTRVAIPAERSALHLDRPSSICLRPTIYLT